MTGVRRSTDTRPVVVLPGGTWTYDPALRSVLQAAPDRPDAPPDGGSGR